ncbi:MAG: 23S rRNA (guanosine(2251)-2'-O)-methyltransferase RlmB [Desulfofustis sp. PB-SRB1]|jgi:23S rRNA (guanosine2251-2'-O)-methyltransferase|nr:23S rRNA (guanosine(2251)-2'-O)-methyltransferase RlmB [Desulfofustis sp. PB-SRB1]MBM1001391.1 23S rRNA (guanosine(2251)-2'-O)-methyltransferase RlmB [Desulfofustis sp. PB-SRB1]HBH28075.1 23S rRNA (guanosine(2251)-2'-O)-methyltransferase RlmB [Desulfofustis sp.]HBH30982.1 23S rRNA (guanosine(2251)-2'-O)-methyltransferase RlmB [Desulfofustis sp.]
MARTPLTKPSRRPAPAEKRVRYSDDLIWGIHPVLALLTRHPHRITELILQRDRRGEGWQRLFAAAKEAQVRYTLVDRLVITGAPDGEPVHQGVVARGSVVDMVSFAELLAILSDGAGQTPPPRILACDSIQDPRNLGALIRSAYAAGIDHILIPRERSAPLGGTAAKASAGALAHVTISRVVNLRDALDSLKKIGFWIYGATAQPQAASIYEMDLTGPICLVIGSEEKGIRPLVQRQCDALIAIPMAGEIDSLNSSVAGAVIMFEMYRQAVAAAK